MQGGSTITMQLDPHPLHHKERTFKRKIREAKLAEELENEHAKDVDPHQYLNTVPFGTFGGQTAVGIQAARAHVLRQAGREAHAARGGAARRPAAGAVSTTPGPLAGEGQARRNEVLRKMAELGMITPQTAQKAMSAGLGIKPSRYFTGRRENYFFDYVKDELFKAYGAERVRRAGCASTRRSTSRSSRPRARRSPAASPASARRPRS